MPPRRTSLYGPVKHYLEMLGFTVKGEAAAAIWLHYAVTSRRWSSSAS